MAKTKKTVRKHVIHKAAKKPWWLTQVSLPFAVVVMLVAAVATLVLVNNAFRPEMLSSVLSAGEVAGTSVVR